MSNPAHHPTAHATSRRIARRTLFAFTLTFALARIISFLIMSQRVPDLYMHVGGTHIHHLNYGIFLLAAVGAYLLFTPVPHTARMLPATLYGVSLALTFDEFGMWLHLGGSYWQRASFDAIIVLASLLLLLAFAPPLRRWRPRDMRSGVVLATTVAAFYVLLAESFRFAARAIPRLQEIEQQHILP